MHLLLNHCIITTSNIYIFSGSGPPQGGNMFMYILFIYTVYILVYMFVYTSIYTAHMFMYIYRYIHTHTHIHTHNKIYQTVVFFLYYIHCGLFKFKIFCNINSDYHSLITCNCQTLYLDFTNTALVCPQWEFIFSPFSNKGTEAHYS